MDEKAVGLSVLAIVAVIALVSAVLLYTDTSALAVYEQPSNNKPAFLQTSVYMEGFNLCRQYVCKSGDVLYGESYPADVYGMEELTGNFVCGCPDGRMFQIRPDRIYVETY
jgi:hypothetical protein